MTTSPASAALSRAVWTAKWLRDIEPAAAQAHNMTLSQLMVRAGTAAYEVAVRAYPSSAHWLILVGAGNNGGDGYVMAKLAKAAGRHVTVLAMRGSGALPLEAATAKAAWEAVGGETVLYNPDEPLSNSVNLGGDDASGVLAVDLIVDGLLGTGITGAPRDAYAKLIDQVNALPAPRFAIDIPSGLNAETGAVGGACISASHTVSFISLKPGLLTGRARAVTGQLHYATLGLEDWLAKTERIGEATGVRLDASDVSRYFPQPRSEVAHKGHGGRVLLVGGDRGFGGAIVMAAEACLSSGAGLTRVLTRPEHVTPLLVRCPEVMVEAAEEGVDRLVSQLQAAMSWCSVIAVGPGLGTSKGFGEKIMQEILSHARAHPEKPVVVDADGLNVLTALQKTDSVYTERQSFALPSVIITPHPGEAARLLQCSVPEVEKDRVTAARQLATMIGGVCLLKGPGSIVCEHQSAPQYAILDAGNAGMAVGGSGDVLTGVIAGLAGQGVPSVEWCGGKSQPGAIFHTACAGGLVHSVAADLLRETVDGHGTRGLRPTQWIPYITRCVNVSE